jgi:zinc transporter, ZIP family
MLGLKAYTARAEKQRGAAGKPPNSLLWTLAIDVFVDGLLVGVGFAAGAKEGILLTVALTGEVFFLGLSSAAVLSRGGASRTRIMTTTLGLSAVMVVGGVLGSAALQGLSGGLLEGVLSFGCAALFYLVTEELLTEAHEEPETPVLTAMFFLGFLLLALLEMAIRQPGIDR